VNHSPVLVVALAAALVVPARNVRAQGPDVPPVRREIPGFDFRRDGVWRREARAVRATRARLLGRRRFDALNAPLGAAGVSGGGIPLSGGAPLATATAVSGVLRVPAVLFRFRDTPPAQLRTAAQYDQVLFAPSPGGASAGRPYTYASWYAELSNGLLSVQGTTYGYVALDSNEVTYTGGTDCTGNPFLSSDCNGLFTNSDALDPVTRMQDGLREALRKIDNQVDWRQYDGNGDGYVDLVAFIQPALDGACGPAGNNHLWSHRFYLNPPYVTHSLNSAGTHLVVSDYILESGVGGNPSCDSTQIMPIGTVAHETGHGFGLPDLYDVSFNSEGIGEYSLMSSGNYSSPFSPSRMDVWSLSELGWVTIAPLPAGGTYSFGPAPTADTAFFVPVQPPNPRGEYFLLENRQAVRSDSAMIRIHCDVSGVAFPRACGGGLLIYHVDSMQLANWTVFGMNTVNAGPIHGLEVVQADGLGNLDANPNGCGGASAGCSDRGDGGDPYPGTHGNVALTQTSVPAARRNSDGKPAGFTIRQITQLAPAGPMQFLLAYPDWVVRAADTAAVIQFDAVTYHVFRGVLDSGSVHSVAVDSVQLTAGGATRQEFRSWSNGRMRTYSDTARATPDTAIARFARWHELVDSATSGGTVTADTGMGHTLVASGTFFAEGTPVRLTATDTSAATVFLSWAGDTVSKSAQITLPMGRPYKVRAVFLAPLATADVVAQLLTGTSALTPQQLQDLDRLGNNNGVFDLGDFLAWVQATGAPLPAAARALLGARTAQGGGGGGGGGARR
jgi:M6 family metalloprotease-like protein